MFSYTPLKTVNSVYNKTYSTPARRIEVIWYEAELYSPCCWGISVITQGVPKKASHILTEITLEMLNVS